MAGNKNSGRGLRQGSRKSLLMKLELGDYEMFVGIPGQTIQDLQKSIASAFRGGQTISNMGFTQLGGLAVFEGELSRPVVKVTKIRPATWQPPEEPPCTA